MQKDFMLIRVLRKDFLIFKEEANKKDEMKHSVLFHKMMKKYFPKKYEGE